MLSRQVFLSTYGALFALLHVSSQAFTPRTARGSFTGDKLSSSPAPTDLFCCTVYPQEVGLNYWWTQTATAYTATVITQYLVYNSNTTTTKLSTVQHNNVSDVAIPTTIIPLDLSDNGGDYTDTWLETGTVMTYANSSMLSPTPNVAIATLGYFPGTLTTDSKGQPSCGGYGGDDQILLDTPYMYAEDPPVTRTSGAYILPPPPRIQSLILAQLTEQYPRATECTFTTASGQPTVHVPVVALTSYTSTTISMKSGASILSRVSEASPADGSNVPALSRSVAYPLVPTVIASSTIGTKGRQGTTLPTAQSPTYTSLTSARNPLSEGGVNTPMPGAVYSTTLLADEYRSSSTKAISSPICVTDESKGLILPLGTIESNVGTIQALQASDGVVLPNSDTLAIGATTPSEDQTLAVTVVVSGTGLATAVEGLEESELPATTLPTRAAWSVSSTESGQSSTMTALSSPDATSRATRIGWIAPGWQMLFAIGILALGDT